MAYVRICEGLADKGKLIPLTKDMTSIYKSLKPDKDYYMSVYQFNETHKKKFDETGSVSGITDVTTSSLYFDFDSKNLEDAKKDVLNLIPKLQKNGIPSDSIQIYFSGNKGFEVRVKTHSELKPSEVKSICLSLAEGLNTVDPVIYNPTRIMRLPLTKHNVSGLYKYPLTIEDVKSSTVQEIKEMAKQSLNYEDIKDVWSTANLSRELLDLKDKAIEAPNKATLEFKLGFSTQDIDWTKIPKNYVPTTWLLEMGYYPVGMRNRALLILAARFKYLEFNANKSYFLLKASADAQSERSGEPRVHKREIWSIINSVFSDTWNNHTFSDKEEPLLIELSSLVPPILNNPMNNEPSTKGISDGINAFLSFAKEIDKNTIKTGLDALDGHMQFQTGRLYAILAAPGVGKTSCCFQIINNISKSGELNMMASYDMGEPDVLEKLALKHLRISKKELYRRVKEESDFVEKLSAILESNYSNTKFIFKTGQTLDELKSSIKEVENSSGRKVRVLIVDYLELIQSKFSDPTQASMESIQGLRDIAISMNICVIVLLQPSKQGTNINEPVTSYTMAKGSSSIQQAVTAMLTLHRPGYSSRTPENDIYMGVDCVKNRSGALFSLDFYFDGRYSEIRDLEPIERLNLQDLRNRMAQEMERDER